MTVVSTGIRHGKPPRDGSRPGTSRPDLLCLRRPPSTAMTPRPGSSERTSFYRWYDPPAGLWPSTDRTGTTRSCSDRAGEPLGTDDQAARLKPARAPITECSCPGPLPRSLSPSRGK